MKKEVELCKLAVAMIHSKVKIIQGAKARLQECILKSVKCRTSKNFGVDEVSLFSP